MILQWVRGSRRRLLTAAAVAVLVLAGAGGYLVARPGSATSAAAGPGATVSPTVSPTRSPAASLPASPPVSPAAAPEDGPSPAPGSAGPPEGTPEPAGGATDRVPDSGHLDEAHAVPADPAATADRAAAPAAVPVVTCGEWDRTPAGRDRTRHASVLLRAEWHRDGSSATPSGTTASAYAKALGTACDRAGTDAALADVSHAAYTADAATWEP